MLYEWVTINWWLAENLDSVDNNSIDLVSDEQIHHHNTENKKN